MNDAMASDNDIDMSVLATLLNKMFHKNQHFSVCDLDKAIKLVGCVPPQRDYDRLQALHCVDYSDMAPLLREQFPDMVMRCLNAPGLPHFEVDDGKLVRIDDRRIKSLYAEDRRLTQDGE